MGAGGRGCTVAAAFAILLGAPACGAQVRDGTPGGAAATTPAPTALLLSYEASGGLLPQDTRVTVTRRGFVTAISGLPSHTTVTTRLSQARMHRLESLAGHADLSHCGTLIHPEAIVVTLTFNGRTVRCVEPLPPSAGPLQRELERLAGARAAPA